MEFCDKCGSFMKETRTGFECQKCGKMIQANAKTRLKGRKIVEHSKSIHVIDHSQDETIEVSQMCLHCGNEKAWHWFTRVSGEHAGIRTERTIEHFKCTKCSFTWRKTS